MFASERDASLKATIPDFDDLTEAATQVINRQKRSRLRKRRLFRALGSTKAATTAVLTILSAYMIRFAYPSETEYLWGLFGTIGAIILATLAYVQWRLNKEEETFDSHVDRIRLANQIFDAYMSEMHREQNEALIDHKLNMLVFTELDNLEYVISKHRSGFADVLTLRRSLRHFWAVLDRPEYTKKMVYWIGESEDERRAKGYLPETCAVARQLIAEARKHYGAARED